MNEKHPMNFKDAPLEFQAFDTAREEDEGIHLREILHILWMRRWMILIIVVLISTPAIFKIKEITPLYTSTATLMVGGNRMQIADVVGMASNDYYNLFSALNNETEILKSRNLARKVIEKLHLDESEEFNPKPKEPGLLAKLHPRHLIPEAWREALSENRGQGAVQRSTEEQHEELISSLVDSFLARLKVEPIEMSNVIKIHYTLENPKLAALIANEIADQYLLSQLDAKFEGTRKTTEWLNDQLAELKQKVEQSEKAVELYRNEKGLAKAGTVTLSAEQLSEMNSELIVARVKRAELEARLRQVEALLKAGANIESATEVMRSPFVQELQSQEMLVQRNLSDMSRQYGARHPKIIQAHAELAELRKKIQLEIKKIASNLRNEVEVARSREGAISSGLASLESTNASKNQAEVQLRALEREAAANRALFENFLKRFKETSTTEGIQEADARVISKAEIPRGPSYPNTNRLITMSIFGSFVAAIAVVFLLEMFNPGLRSPEQIEVLLKRPTLGVIPLLRDGKPLDYLLKNPQSSLSEAVHSLRVSLLLLDPDKTVKTVLVTSSVPEEGKSTLAALLARQAAGSGQSVVLVDADLRRPTIEKMFAFGKPKGITDYLMNPNSQYRDFIVKDEASGLHVIGRGLAEFVNPADLFASHRMEALIKSLSDHYDLVVIDSPPVMSVTDSRVLSRLADKTLFVVRWDFTPRKVIKTAVRQISEASNNVAGIVLQRVNLKQYGRYSYGDSGHYYHYGRYRQYYSNG
ncbi:MAG: GumC family protein [Gammaproteobacteria bacterium]